MTIFDRLAQALRLRALGATQGSNVWRAPRLSVCGQRKPSTVTTVILWGVLVASFLAQPAAAVTTFKIATLSPEGTSWMKLLRGAAKNIDARTDGEVKFKFYPGGVMGDDKAVLRKLRIGQLHGAALTSGGGMQPYPDIVLYNLPLLFRTLEEVDYVRSKMDSKLMRGLREKGFVGFGLAELGFAYPMMREAATSVTEFQRRRVWAPDNDPGALKAFSAFGVTPIPLPLADVLAGLQTGLIDTIASPPIGAIALQWHNQVGYAIDLPLIYVYGLFAIADRQFNKLSPEQQEIVTAELTTAVAAVDASSRKDHLSALRALETQGIEWLQPVTAEREEWFRLAETANDGLLKNDYVSTPMYLEMMQHLRDFRAVADDADTN